MLSKYRSSRYGTTIEALLLTVLLTVACSVVGQNDSQSGSSAAVFDLDVAERAEPLPGGNLEDMLHWAIKNSDPNALKETATARNVTADAQRRTELREIMDAMRKAPTEAQLMKAHLQAIADSGADDGSRLQALRELKELVRPVDNANDLKPLGGIEVLLAALSSGNSSVRAEAASVLAVAASNNVKFQRDVHSVFPDIVYRLLQVLQDPVDEIAKQGLHATGRFLCNDAHARLQFYRLEGLAILERLAMPTSPPTLRLRAINLLADLAALGLPKQGLAPLFLESVVKAVKKLLTDDAADWAATESNCRLLQALLRSNAASAGALRQCGLEAVLQKGQSVLKARAADLTGTISSGEPSDQENLQDLIRMVDDVILVSSAHMYGTDYDDTGFSQIGQQASSHGDVQQQQQEVLQLGPPPGQGSSSKPESVSESRNEL